MAERVFVLPDLGEGLEEAVVSAWLVAEGDEVELNQPFVEVETAKATVEVPAPWAGRVARLHVPSGATIAVGAELVTFEVAGAAGGAVAPAEDGGASPGSPRTGTPAIPRGPGGVPVSATPAVRRLAKDLGVDLDSVTGSGPSGRVTREDVETAAGTRASADEVKVVPVSLVRRTIARNLEEVARIPQVTTFRTVDCAALDGFRRELGVSPLPVFVAALAATAAEHPWVNASWGDEGIALHRVVNVGIATDTERGLVVPVLRDAGTKGIAELSEAIARLAEAARSNALAHEELSGATIAVSNTGAYGSEYGTPLLNPGHAVTIALGVIAPRALVLDGQIEARPTCTLSCTFDHRVLDGATIGRALGALVASLESRERLEALPR